jgi:hypothetical protein
MSKEIKECIFSCGGGGGAPRHGLSGGKKKKKKLALEVRDLPKWTSALM